MNRGFQKGLSESQSRFVLASSSMAWKDYSPLRRKLVVWGGGGCHFSRGTGKPRKKYSDVGVRCDSQVLRVLGKQSLDGGNPTREMLGSGSEEWQLQQEG